MTDFPPPPPPAPGSYPSPHPSGGYPPPIQPKKKPIYKKWWFWVGIVVVIAIIASAANGSKKDDKNDTAGGSPTSSAPSSSAGVSTKASTQPKTDSAPSGGVSRGLGSSKAAKDVTLGKLTSKKDQLDTVTYSAAVSITNNSSKRSDYFVTVSLESADGKSQIDSATVFVENLEPGQSKQDSADFLEATLGSVKVPAGAIASLKEVQRTEST